MKTPRDFKEFTVFTAPIDLQSGDNYRGQVPASKVEVLAGTGSLTLDTEGDVNRIATISAVGGVVECKLRRIVSVTGVTRVRVYWED